jgi:hypothetical protein
MFTGVVDIPWTASYACTRILQNFLKLNPVDRPLLDDVIKEDWLQISRTTSVPRPLCDVPQLDGDKMASILRQFHAAQFRGPRPQGQEVKGTERGRIKVSPSWLPQQRQITIPRINKSTLNPPFAARVT